MTDPKKLAADWASLYQSAGEAIDWTATARGNSPRLDNEADDLILSLRRIRNNAKRLGSVSELPMTVGFFGLSQAGKSYLISAMAAGKNGDLETELGGKRLDFITHINPPGGGKEATGLVTRFSRTASPGPDDFPLELKLFGEVELVKLLANSFFNDFNAEKASYRFDDGHITALLQTLSKRKSPRRIAGVTEDDVVSLGDYLQDNFPGSLSALSSQYWQVATELAPWLLLEDRCQLFSIFWGEIPELSAAYLDFAKTLASLNHAERVFAPLSALVRETANGGLSQADSIMNVEMLERLGRSEQTIAVRPWHQGELGEPVEISLPQLAALTVELVFPLVEPTAEPLFEQVDLLDFPGYRGRLSVESLDDVRRAVSSEEASAVAQLILRGKVAYLFERYTDSQEMNVLIVCTPSNKQSDVTSVGPVLSRWIEKTQGVTPEQRARRKPGLLWVVTMFDMRISSDLDKGEDLLRLGWGSGGMMKMCMLERFGQYPWLQEWSNGKPFANCFLARKPQMKVTFLQLGAGNVEQAVSTSCEAPLALMRKTFCEDDTVRRHIEAPEAAWDAMLRLNDGGIGRIAEYLRKVALREVKLARIAEQLDEILLGLESRLGRWFQGEGSGELTKKRQIAQQIYQAIWPRRVLLGELLSHLQLPPELLRPLYLRAQEDAPAEVETEAVPVAASGGALDLGDSEDDDQGFDLFGSTPAPLIEAKAEKPAARGSDAQFAKAVLREWIAHLRHLPENLKLMSFLGFDKTAVEALVDELITAASRLDLESTLLSAITSVEQIGTRREQLAGRQVLVASNLLGDFIGWLGFAGKPASERPTSQLAAGKPLFEPPAVLAENTLPVLAEKPQDYARQYIGDWLVGLAQICQDNAGHSAGLEISIEQNEALGRLLATLRGLHQG